MRKTGTQVVIQHGGKGCANFVRGEMTGDQWFFGRCRRWSFSLTVDISRHHLRMYKIFPGGCLWGNSVYICALRMLWKRWTQYKMLKIHETIYLVFQRWARRIDHWLFRYKINLSRDWGLLQCMATYFLILHEPR